MKGKFLVLGVAILVLAWAHPASAADCSFSKETKELQSLKGNSDAADKELELRQNILYGILDCLASSTETLKSNYDSLPYSRNGINLKMRFMDQLHGNLFYYGEKRKVVESADIPQTKLLAKELLDWKKSHENDLASASYFLLWVKNRNLLSLAKDRAEQISNLKLSDKNRVSLLQAQGALAAADSLSSSAQEFLEQSAPPQNALSLIKQSLGKLLDSYRYFIKIGDSQ